ncbi:hypothetical protein MIMGU_mgv1a019611mg, partial [Erythranthe guttata]
MGRKACCDKSETLKRGKWEVEEDEKLINYINANGEGSWRSLPTNAGLKRCGKSCRLRWINYLKSGLKRGSFTPHEDETIVKFHNTFGNKWSLIASNLPGRTDNEIKNYWNSHLSRRTYLFRSTAVVDSKFIKTHPTKRKKIVTNNNNNNNNEVPAKKKKITSPPPVSDERESNTLHEDSSLSTCSSINTADEFMLDEEMMVWDEHTLMQFHNFLQDHDNGGGGGGGGDVASSCLTPTNDEREKVIVNNNNISDEKLVKFESEEEAETTKTTTMQMQYSCPSPIVIYFDDDEQFRWDFDGGFGGDEVNYPWSETKEEETMFNI